jgi:hypothetical protein
MAEQCFNKKGSNPQVCGIHNVALVAGHISIDSNAPVLGHISCYLCPVSREVLPDDKTQKEGRSASGAGSGERH